MIAKALVVLFLIIPLIISCLTFVIGVTYLQVKDEQVQKSASAVVVFKTNRR